MLCCPLAQGLVEELKKLRAAEESTVALVDEEMTARFSGDVTLTVCDAPIVLSPHQVRPGFRQPLAVCNGPVGLSQHQVPSDCQPSTFFTLPKFVSILPAPSRLSHMARTRRQTVSGLILTIMRYLPHSGQALHEQTSRPYTEAAALGEERLAVAERVMKQ